MEPINLRRLSWFIGVWVKPNEAHQPEEQLESTAPMEPMESNEPMDIFWIDLKNPENVGKQYKTE